MEEAIAKATEEIIDKFEEQWKPAMENLQEAESVFDDLDGTYSLSFEVFSLRYDCRLDLKAQMEESVPGHLK